MKEAQREKWEEEQRDERSQNERRGRQKRLALLHQPAMMSKRVGMMLVLIPLLHSDLRRSTMMFQKGEGGGGEGRGVQ